MPREVVQNNICEFVFGMDTVTGPFFQIWALNHALDDAALFTANNLGILVLTKPIEAQVGSLRTIITQHLPKLVNVQALEQLLLEARTRFEDGQKIEHLYVNMDENDVWQFAKCLGFNENVRQMIYELWGLV